MLKKDVHKILVLIILASAAFAQDTDSLTDYRRDKDWEWYSDPAQVVDLYYYDWPRNDMRSSLPWNEGNSFLYSFMYIGNSSGEKDILPEQGWVLMLRDFGEKEHPCYMPYMLFYNKYHGILRYLYWGTKPHFGGFAVGKLELISDDYTPLLELSALRGSGFINDHSESDQVNSITVLGGCGPIRWNILDFDVSGYDPLIASKTVKAKITIELYDYVYYEQYGERHDLVQNPFYDVFDYLYPLVYGSNIGDGYLEIFTDVNNAAVRLRDSGQLRKYINTWAHKDSMAGKWYAGPILQATRNLDNASWLPALSPYSALLPYIKGGGSVNYKYIPRAVCSVPTDLKLAFKDHLGSLPNLYFYLPGSNVPDREKAVKMNELPLYELPMGVFSMVEKPQVDYGYLIRNVWQAEGSNLYAVMHDNFVKLQGPPLYEVNPHVFDLEKSTVRFSLVSEQNDISDFVSSIQPEAFAKYTNWFKYRHASQTITRNPMLLPDTLFQNALKTIKFSILAELYPLGKDDEYIPVQIVKAYDLCPREYVGMMDQGDVSFPQAKMLKSGIPELFTLEQNYPNPFNPVTTIPFSLSSDAHVEMVIYNILGREIETLTNRQYMSGQHYIRFDGSNLPDGIYFVRARMTGINGSNASHTMVCKMMLVK